MREHRPGDFCERHLTGRCTKILSFTAQKVKKKRPLHGTHYEEACRGLNFIICALVLAEIFKARPHQQLTRRIACKYYTTILVKRKEASSGIACRFIAFVESASNMRPTYT